MIAISFLYGKLFQGQALSEALDALPVDRFAKLPWTEIAPGMSADILNELSPQRF